MGSQHDVIVRDRGRMAGPDGKRRLNIASCDPGIAGNATAGRLEPLDRMFHLTTIGAGTITDKGSVPFIS